MEKIKSIIVGYGSIGKRHASIQRELGIVPTIVTKQKLSPEENLAFFGDLREALSHTKADFVLISNETNLHLQTLTKLEELNFQGKILCEKPISVNSFSLDDLPRIKDNILVTYNLRFHPLIQKLKVHLEKQKVISFLAYVGQYLPDWRPNTDYSSCYSAKKQGGGGVLRDLSHEIDFSSYLFGPPKNIRSFIGHVSDLKIETEDIANINWITQNNGIGFLSLNYLDRKVSRFMIVNTQAHTFKIDFISQELWIDNEVTKIESHRNTSYLNMYHEFLNGNFDTFCSPDEALKTLKIIEQSLN